MREARRLTGAAIVACLFCTVLAVPAQAAPKPAWAPIASSGPTNLPPTQSEEQQVAVGGTGGSFKLTFEGQETAPVSFDALPGEVETALDALASIGGAGGSVVVRGDESGETPAYDIAFGGSLGGLDVPQIGVDGSGLTGGVATASTLVPGGAGTTMLAIYAQNIGGLSSSGQITMKVELPEGVTTTQTPESQFTNAGEPWSCSPGAGQSSFECTTEEAVGPGLTPAAIDAPVQAGPAASGVEAVEISYEGGGAPLATYEMPLTISYAPAKSGYQAFTAGAYDDEGHLDSRAGDHPYTALAAVVLNTVRSARGLVVPAGEFKDILADLPPGFIGDPVATPQCPESTTGISCPADTIVGVAAPLFDSYGWAADTDAIFNMQAPYGYPAKFRFVIGGNGDFTEVSPVGELRSDEDFGIRVASLNTSQAEAVYGFFFSFWGAPGSPSHDGQRCANIETQENCAPAADETAFLTNAVNCAEQATTPPFTRISFDTWQEPGIFNTRDIPIPPVAGCDQLHFEGGLTFQPTEGAPADSPAGFATEVKMPTEGLIDPSKLIDPELRKAVVRFPEGLVLNPSAADGLGACSEAQIGLRGTDFPEPNRIRFNKSPNTCPDSAKIGTVEVHTPLLANPLHGALYLAAQGEGNPFGSLFAVYLVIEDPSTGVFVKLAGRTEADPKSGQLTATFEDTPQLPIESLKLAFKGGARSPFATPETCGAFTTDTEMTPWSAPESGPPLNVADSFSVSSGANGAPCVASASALPFGLGFEAGSASPRAGAFSPFDIRVTRPDGAQQIDSVSIRPPLGFAATLKGVPFCTEAQIGQAESRSGRSEQEHPACPQASQVGTTTVGAGSGSNPFYAPGRLYLAGPYKSAPISVVAITPAVAGPFDLGNVVVRTAVRLDPASAQITATSDPLPRFLDGVATRVRDIRIHLDRPDWALNPTDCEPTAVTAGAQGAAGASASLADRYQVGGCEALGFKPRLKLTLEGGTKRGGHPALRGVFKPRPGDANLAKLVLRLPHSAFLDQAHIRTICTRVQFAAGGGNGEGCPAGSVYGHATAYTPLLDEPLQGPVYLRSSSHNLPDFVAALHGLIDIEAVARIDSVHGGIRATFAQVPDAPLSKVIVDMQGAKKGLIVNSTDLCAARHRAAVTSTAHDNARTEQRPLVGASGCPKRHGQRHRR